MNYKPLIQQKISELIKDIPDMTFSEILFSTLSVLSKSQNIKTDFKKSDLLTTKDKDFYSALCKVHTIEKEQEL